MNTITLLICMTPCQKTQMQMKLANIIAVTVNCLQAAFLIGLIIINLHK